MDSLSQMFGQKNLALEVPIKTTGDISLSAHWYPIIILRGTRIRNYAFSILFWVSLHLWQPSCSYCVLDWRVLVLEILSIYLVSSMHFWASINQCHNSPVCIYVYKILKNHWEKYLFGQFPILLHDISK